MRVLVISYLDVWTMGNRKGAKSFHALLSQLIRSGHEVTLITARGERNLVGGTDDSAETLEGIRIIDVLQDRSKEYGDYSRFTLLTVLKAWTIRGSFYPDLIYAHEFMSVPGAVLLAKLFRASLVVRHKGIAHSNLLLQPFNLRTFRSFIPFIKRIIAFRVSGDVIILTNDGTQGDRVLERLGVDMKKVHFWVNGIDPELLTAERDPRTIREDLNLASSSKILLIVSRLQRWKGVHRAIAAMPHILSEEPKVHLVVIGDGEELSALGSQVDDLGLQRSVHFTGAIYHEMVIRYMLGADLLLSTQDQTNLGNPVLEAMATGLCVVALDVGDTSRIVRNGHTGCLISSTDERTIPLQLANCVVLLLRDEKLRHRLGQSAREYVGTNTLTWEDRIRKEVDLLEAIGKKRHIDSNQQLDL